MSKWQQQRSRNVREYLSEARLYLILDRDVKGYDGLFEILTQAVEAGVDIIQLRDKVGTAREIIDFSRKCIHYIDGRLPWIINDRVDIALAVGADGVHLGQDDLPIAQARAISGETMIVGSSCQTIEQVEQAQQDGADYIGFGSVFKTLTKPDRSEMNLDLLRQVIVKSHIPAFAIGGINQERLSQIRDVGIKRIAVTRAICLAEDIPQAIEGLLASF